MDRILNEIARLLLDELGAHRARIFDGGVDAEFGPVGAVRVEVTRRP